ncbi:TPA: hypothetical protein N0F65_005519 [Lagenidium giganteum]|uniref:ELMO domain-containing protein n=1 Tax=Lagenidium giganteum TaxID=4803 RepID=A0AAV2YJF6_9STRA|nr:TPA: hypothetical protein N0F65_005519 [Lagenidium giganteum]
MAHENDRGVLCHYFLQNTLAEDELPEIDVSSCLLLSPHPTLSELRRRFPFEGRYHFRLQQQMMISGKPSYCWIDLLEPNRVLSSNRGEIFVKVLQLSPNEEDAEGERWAEDQVDVPEDRLFEAYFRHQEANAMRHHPSDGEYGGSSSSSPMAQDVGAMFSGVKKALASKMKQSVVAQNLQKRSAKMWEKVTGSSSGVDAPPTAAALSQLAKLVGSMKAPLNEQNPEHVDLLRRLWACCFDPEPFLARGGPWGTLGFRQEDPIRELQCVLPLQCLVFFHEVHRNVALPIVNDQAPGGADTFSYALVACRIAFMLADLLQLRDGACLGAERPFWRLFEDPIAFYEVFSLAYRAFDQSWRVNGNKTTEIGYHLDYTADFVQEILRKAPDSVQSVVEYAHHLQKW